MTEETTSWTILSPVPHDYFADPMLINDNEIIIAPTNYKPSMYKYLINQNTWIDSTKYPSLNIWRHTACYNKNTGIIYI